MKDAIEMNIAGIKCDNPDCDYVNMDVKVEEYDNWLNKPCPKYGENLLTEKDLKNTKLLASIVGSLNNIFPKRAEDEEEVTAIVEMNGTGEINFSVKD